LPSAGQAERIAVVPSWPLGATARRRGGSRYLRIVDRKKELIINAAGKNMSPAKIELRLKAASPLIGQCICIGDRRPYNVALIVLDPDAGAAHARAGDLDDASAFGLAASDEVRALVAQAIDQTNSHLSRVEQIKRFTILATDWLSRP
jgi:long-chain acyl-CoA synthetase